MHIWLRAVAGHCSAASINYHTRQTQGTHGQPLWFNVVMSMITLTADGRGEAAESSFQVLLSLRNFVLQCNLPNQDCPINRKPLYSGHVLQCII